MNQTSGGRLEQAEQALMRAYLFWMEGESRESIKRSRYAMQYAYLAIQESRAIRPRMSNDTLTLGDWLEVSPTVRVSGPSHKVVLAGVVSSQPDNDAEDIRIEENQTKIFIKRRNEQKDDRIFTLTYRVNVHGAEYFINKKVGVRKA
jgi:hypothetical protein